MDAGCTAVLIRLNEGSISGSSIPQDTEQVGTLKGIKLGSVKLKPTYLNSDNLTLTNNQQQVPRTVNVTTTIDDNSCCKISLVVNSYHVRV